MKKIIFLIVPTLLLSSCADNMSDKPPITNSINTTQVEETITKKINFVNVWIDDFKLELAKKDWILIDLRTPEELEESWVIEWAINIDFYASDFREKLNSLDKDKKYLIYCRSGSRSWKTFRLMKSLWFTNVYNFTGSMNSWLRNWEKTVVFWENKKIEEKIINISAKNWEFDTPIITVKKWEKIRLKINNTDWLHWIAIPAMRIVEDNEIILDTSKKWEFEYVCANYCGAGHSAMKWKIIIE